MPNITADAISSNGFRVEIDGLTVDDFLSVEALESTSAIIEYRNGGDLLTHKLPGNHSYGNVALTRGWTGDTALWDWRRSVIAGQVDRRSCSVIVLDAARAEVSRVNLFGAWPCRWRLGPWHGTADGPLVETVELAVERLELA